MGFDFSKPVISGTQSQNWFGLQNENDNEIFQLTVTSDVTVEYTSKLTNHKVLDKSVVTDNVVDYNKKVRYNGIITSIERLDQPDYKTPSEYFAGLDSARKDKTLFTVLLDDQLDFIPSCYIESLSFTKGSREGLTSWRVDISLQQIRLSEGVTTSSVPNPALKGATEGQKSVGSASTKSKPITQTKFAEALSRGG